MTLRNHPRRQGKASGSRSKRKAGKGHGQFPRARSAVDSHSAAACAAASRRGGTTMTKRAIVAVAALGCVLLTPLGISAQALSSTRARPSVRGSANRIAGRRQRRVISLALWRRCRRRRRALGSASLVGRRPTQWWARERSPTRITRAGSASASLSSGAVLACQRGRTE